ncbi:MAG: tol-pal system protein YbgF [Gemmatimonadota bacterium]
MALGLVLSAACATKSDIVDLRSTMLAELRSDRAAQDSLRFEIARLRAVLLDSLGVQERRGVSGRVELQRQVEELNVALARLIELTGQTQADLTRLQDRAAAGAPDGPLEGADAGEADTPAPGGVAGDPQALYETALRQFRRGSYETARAGLDEFLRLHPDHELAPDAQYFRAETFAEEDRPEDALREYARILELYPNSRRAPSALYKSGRIELERGNTDDARSFFSRVVQGYPDSDEATLATEELGRLRD